MIQDPTDDPKFTAALDLLHRTGIKTFQIRFSDDEKPIVWMAIAEWNGEKYEAAASLHPTIAIFRLLAQVLDGGQCTHCKRPTGFSEDTDELPGGDFICWYQWDPELRTFRRGCE